MEVSTQLLALYTAPHSWNRCWFFCSKHGIIYIYWYGMLGKEWRLVNGILRSDRIWIWMVISTDPSNIHLAGKFWERVYQLQSLKPAIINVTSHLWCKYYLFISSWSHLLLRTTGHIGCIAYFIGLFSTQIFTNYIIRINNLQRFRWQHYTR